MKLRNKKTGEIVDFQGITMFKHPSGNWAGSYKKLSELNEEWEDTTVKDIKYYYCISMTGGVHELVYYGELTQAAKDKMAIGNYFESQEEAEKALEKLKAWKRLKDNGFVINKWLHTPDMNLTTGSFITIKGYIPQVMKNMKDLDLLFGGSDDN